MLKLLSPREIINCPYSQQLVKAEVPGGWNYALDHAWFYAEIDRYINETSLDKPPIIADIGCGDSRFHGYLERSLNIGIIGIDRINGLCARKKRSINMDICRDFLTDNIFLPGSLDIVYWCSSIEHNPPDIQQRLVEASMSVLRPGGLFLATFGYSQETHYFEASQQWNISLQDAVAVFGESWEGETDFETMVAEYRENHFSLDDLHTKRYKTDRYAFLVAAAKKVKA